MISARESRIEATKNNTAQSHVSPHTNCVLIRNLWIVLLIQHKQLANQYANPVAMRRLKKFGTRRINALVMRLDREYQKSQEMALKGCCPPQLFDLLIQDNLNPPCYDLHQNLKDLGECYQELLRLLAPPVGSNRYNWLESRARVHLAQADLLKRGV